MARLPSTAAVNDVADAKQHTTTTHKALLIGIASLIYLKTKLPLSSPRDELPTEWPSRAKPLSACKVFLTSPSKHRTHGHR